ncbi:hypothetical protein [Oceanibium sediminis]|uniref:hypothetical protein n=1 Tax=Oceanibium sediminis TaxID=2026339 RepID=UPI001E310FA4|nr:hypothetical protein [Oceanibium sediminis]
MRTGPAAETQRSMLNVLIVAVTVATGALLLYPRLARARLWRAAITPLASIIGSGFLVLGPILDVSFGTFAPLVMAGLCLGAYAFGAAVRFNIRRLSDTKGARSRVERVLETGASWALVFAYVISVAYYLNLLGAFSVSLTAQDDAFHAKLVTTAVFAVILIVGGTHGFGALERMEQISAGVKLAIIAGLLYGLAWYATGRAGAGALEFHPATVTGLPAVLLAAGLLVTVQGFETSRYLGAEYDATERIRSMRLAQALAAAIYMIYVCLVSIALTPGTMELSETAIIGLVAVVAPILPLLLIAAAISAQFSAAVADTSGSGGLLAELTHGRITQRMGYAMLVAIGVVLTWSMSVFQIISFASRAFAVYYAIQALIAAQGAMLTGKRGKALAFALMGVAGVAIAIFGTAVE